MVKKMLDPSQFAELMVVPRVGPEMHRQAMRSFLRYYDNIHDAVFAMYSAFASATSTCLPGYDSEANLQRGTLALKKLRGLPCPKDREDFEAWLWFATSILIHARCALGSSASPVRRYILGCLDQMGEQGKHFRSHPVVVSIAALDIYDSLIHGQMPVMDIPKSDLVGNDSFLGLCSTLLRFTYELCKINCRMKLLSAQSDGLDKQSESLLNDLEMSVEAWQPDVSTQTISELSSMEVTHVLTQARVHRTAILLFGRRLRYPFGVQDAPAKRMANSILSELNLATFTSRKTPNSVMLPFLIVATEATELSDREKILRDTTIHVDSLSPKSQEMARVFLKALWNMRDTLPGFRWIDMVARLPPLCVTL